jgi:hypothetical protein
MEWFLAAAGSWAALRAGGHDTTWPSSPFEQLVGIRAPASLTGLLPGGGGVLAEGLGAGAVLAEAAPADGSTAATVAVTARRIHAVL